MWRGHTASASGLHNPQLRVKCATPYSVHVEKQANLQALDLTFTDTSSSCSARAQLFQTTITCLCDGPILNTYLWLEIKTEPLPGLQVARFLVQGEPSFEDEILRRTPCTVHTFDPTLDDAKRENLRRFPDLRVHEIGIGNETKREVIAGFDAEVQTLQQIMGEPETFALSVLTLCWRFKC